MPMQRNAYKYPSANVKGSMNNGLFVEMWYFELYDEVNQVEFAIMCCIDNPANSRFGKIFGFARSSDIMCCVAFDDRRNAENDMYFPTFDANEDVLRVNIGDAVFLEAIDDQTIHLHGESKGVGCNFDLQFTRDFPELDAMKTVISKRKNDNFWFYANMPRARVTGTVTMDGETRSVDCHGYHDHDWGSPTKIAWSPWSVATGDDFGIVTYTSDRKYGNVFLFFDGGWKTFPLPSMRVISTKECMYKGKGNEDVHYQRPTTIALMVEKDGLRLEYVIKERDGDKCFLLDYGLEKKQKAVHAPATIAVNYLTTGKIYKNNVVVKEFHDVNTSFQWYECMDYFKYIKFLLF